MLTFDHSTMYCRFGAVPVRRTLTLLAPSRMRSPQNGAIRACGTTPVPPFVNVTVAAGNVEFWDEGLDSPARLNHPLVEIDKRSPGAKMSLKRLNVNGTVTYITESFKSG